MQGKQGSSYNYKWQRRRRTWLLNHPLCRYCEEAGEITAASVVDHIIPHKGDEKLFWDQTNWQSLCKKCHDSAKKKEEAKGYSTAIGIDGWPIDKKHPVNDAER